VDDVLRILVVDDEPGMRLGVERALRDWKLTIPEADGPISLTVSQAGSGTEAMEQIAHAPPDILLLDHMLPGMSGLDVLAEIGHSTPILTIMITAYASLETAITATKRGAFDFLAKPFTPGELRAAIQKAARHLVLQREARKLAEERRQVRFQFLSVLAHELKAPLAAIEGYLHILRDHSAGDDPEVHDRMLGRCLYRAEGMRKLILDLLDLTRIESGLKKRELAEVPFREVARHAVETVLPEAAKRNVAVTLHCETEIPLRADRSELEIILNNLLSNAVKYNRPGGKVDLTAAAEGEMLAIEVADTGIGMTPQEQQRLFQDFVRIRNEKTRDTIGSGLGLSILKKLASLYGGDVSVRSQPDVGSTFRVTLRLREPVERESARNQALAAGD
jgi:two-component system, sensor histidine kinase and response regulator